MPARLLPVSPPRAWRDRPRRRLHRHGRHPHLHLFVTDGGVRPDETFVSWLAHDTARLTEAFRRAVLRLFVRLALFAEEIRLEVVFDEELVAEGHDGNREQGTGETGKGKTIREYDDTWRSVGLSRSLGAMVDRLNAALEGRYRVDREIGVGGMATVYLAEDVKHHRKVAIKVLREDLAASVGAARFLREIEIAAQLQHPHIVPLLDSGEAGGLLFYVMPFVEGKTLRERLDRDHQLPVGESVRILMEIVDALSAAHAHNVVHRDIKPDNVMLMGRHALVADFGVARAVSEATEGNSITTLGVALGTPTYMSPEQASADPLVDHRTDIYSVGIVAYEMLAGQLPFSARSPQQMLAAHVTETPESVSTRRPGLNPQLVATVMRCLEKLPADRWQTADELLAALEPFSTSSGGTTPTTARVRSARSRKPLVWMSIGAAAAIAVVVVAASHLADRSNLSFTVGRSRQLTSDAGLQIFPELSPDGKLVAYAAGNSRRMRIYVRPLDGGRNITVSDDSSTIENQPRWSPDGSQLLFLAHDGVSIAPALGGAARPVIAPSSTRGVETADWAPDGKSIVFSRGDSLQVVPLAGGATRLVAVAPALTACRWSPNDKWIACVSGNETYGVAGSSFANIAPSKIVVIPVAGGAIHDVTGNEAMQESPQWSEGGAHLYFISNRDGPQDVYEVTIGSNGEARGAAKRVTTGLNAHSFSIDAHSQRLAYAVYSGKANIWSLPASTGTLVPEAAASPVTTGVQIIETLSISPDGKWLLYDSNLDGRANIYRMPLTGGTPEQLTREQFNVFAPALSPDGRTLAYHSFRNGTRDIEVKPLNGGPRVNVTNTPGSESYPDWSPDGKRIAYWNRVAQSKIFVVRQEAPGKWSVPVERGNGMRPTWSPDGRWLAFSGPRTIAIVSPDSGPARVLHEFPADEEENRYPLWSPDGMSIIYKTHDREGRAEFWSIAIAGGTPRLLARLDDINRPSFRANFAFDGKRFYFTIDDRQGNIWVAETTKP